MSCSDDPSSQSVDVEIVLQTIRQVGPLAYSFDIAVEPPTEVKISYWAADTPILANRIAAAANSEIPVVRLLPDSEYEFELRPTRGEGTHVRGSFNTGSLPADFEQLDLRADGVATAPLTMLEVRHTRLKAFVAVDAWGRPVWYHRTEGSSYCWAQRPNFNLIVNDTSGGVKEISPLGNVIQELASEESQRVHHEILSRPDGNVWFLQTVDRELNGTVYTGDQITQWSPDDGSLRVLWCAFDHLSPLTDWGEHSVETDWLHLNSLRVGASGNILISSPFLNQVIAITPDLSGLVWRMGGPNESITPDASAHFEFQHTAHEIEQDHVLLFDNRGALAAGGTYSRALQVRIDQMSGTATQEWSFHPPNDNYASIMSSAYRMPNGNTSIAFGPGDGLFESRGPVEVYESTPSGEVVWHLEIVDLPHMYRATPFETLAGERVVPALDFEFD